MVMRAASSAGDPLILAAVTMVAGVLLGVLRRSPGPVLLAGSGGFTIMLKEALGRPWPPLNGALAAAEGHAFPSAHAAVAAAVFGVLAYLYAARFRSWSARVAVWAGAGMLTMLVGISRVYLGVHWTTDVIGGWAFGTAWLAVVVTGWTIFTSNLDSREAGRARLQCACGGADQDKDPRLQRAFLNSTGRRPQAESGQRRRRDGYHLRILAGLRWFSMLGQLRSTRGPAGNCKASAQVTLSTLPPAGAGLNSITAPGIQANRDVRPGPCGPDLSHGRRAGRCDGPTA